MSKLMITDTIFRDAHQSLAATRMRTEDMLPACEVLDSIGYYSLEVWGGATFDACLRFLNEDPWQRLRTLRKALPNTKLQMLFRGQNILGYKHYADDVVEQFCKKAIENGIDVIRIFDAVNDIRNLESGWVRTRSASRTWQTCCCRMTRIRSFRASRRKSRFRFTCTRITRPAPATWFISWRRRLA
jgi:oxaloacetate decarboxylase alpha subunit